ncbi:uncharacterized protein [Ptychodera flava]|uniref:uncharacterized protein n=1 Tax=Ptychodera flava TaxID=63121 RepID=UPI003969CA64
MEHDVTPQHAGPSRCNDVMVEERPNEEYAEKNEKHQGLFEINDKGYLHLYFGGDDSKLSIPHNVTLFYMSKLNEELEEQVIQKFCEILRFSFGPNSDVDTVNILNCIDDDDDGDDAISRLQYSDRVVFVLSKSFRTMWDERELTADDDAMERLDRIMHAFNYALNEEKKPDFNKYFAIRFSYTRKTEMPKTLKLKCYEISVCHPSTIEKFYARLLQQRGKVSMPQVLETITNSELGQELVESVRRLQTRDVTKLIDRGKSVGFSPCDLDSQCFDVLFQHEMINENEQQEIKRKSSPQEKLNATSDIISKKGCIFVEYKQLVEVWQTNLTHKLHGALQSNFCDLIGNIGPDVPAISDFLQQQEVFTAHASQIVREGTPQDKARKLLGELPKTERAFNSFCDALDKYNSGLAKSLNLRGFASSDDGSDESSGPSSLTESEDDPESSAQNSVNEQAHEVDESVLVTPAPPSELKNEGEEGESEEPVKAEEIPKYNESLPTETEHFREAEEGARACESNGTGEYSVSTGEGAIAEATKSGAKKTAIQKLKKFFRWKNKDSQSPRAVKYRELISRSSSNEEEDKHDGD